MSYESSFRPAEWERLLNDLIENFTVKGELSMIARGLSLKYGRRMAAASLALLTVKNHYSRTIEELDSRTCEELEK